MTNILRGPLRSLTSLAPVVEDETKKQLAAGSEDQGIIPFRASFDPFNMIMQQLGRLDLARLCQDIERRLLYSGPHNPDPV
ncbi:MAG: hypothetical protein M1609_01120, partial [Firmicutes bacterium]|nr:hypothetical protein [Bacillota bacterium]